MSEDYTKFLKSKMKKHDYFGFEVDTSKLNPMLFDFQKAIVKWCLKKGKSAVFADCGLGKTLIQLEWSNKIYEKHNKPILILTPLAVSMQTLQEHAKFNMNTPIKIIKTNEDVINGLNICNYEKLHLLDCSKFVAVVLDESSILKNYTGMYKRLIIKSFKTTQFKLCCTATPSPNDDKEMGNHSEFLNIMPSNEMLSRWFINDTMKMNGYRLKHHAKKDFYRWISSWAICISKPSDIGYEDKDFNLPKLNIIEDLVDIENNDFESGFLLKINNVNATNFNKELRITMQERMEYVADKVNNSSDTFIVWVKLNTEADLIKKLIPDAVEVRGNEKNEDKETKLLDFAKGKHRVLITKSKIAQFGMNFQNCSNQIFASLDFSFESLYQSIRRSYRFGQKKEVNISLITLASMGNVISTIREKQERFLDMQKSMSKAISKTFLEETKNEELKLNTNIKSKKTDFYKVYLGDSCEVIKQIPDNSVDFQIFSPPFSSLYIYSDNIQDMGNCADDDEFFRQFDFLIPELKRILRPGRLIAVHCKNLVNYINQHGKSGMRDFRGDIIRAFTKHNFSYHAEVTIWKDPVTEMYRTKAHGLLYKQLRTDSSFSRTGLAEYLVLFRKWSENPEEQELEVPIDTKTKDNFPLEQWQSWASPVWTDINQTNVLNIKMAKANHDEKHICPLQLDIISRSVEMWSNPNEIVFSPFAGIGSEGYVSIEHGRKFIGIELKEEYYNNMIKNIDSLIESKNQLDLFQNDKDSEA